MIPIACTLIRRFAPLLAPFLVVGALGCGEDADSPTAPEGSRAATPALDITPTAGLSFQQVSKAFFHVCGVTTNNVAYCWGENDHGQLGDGTTNNSPTPVPVAGGLLFRHVTAGDAHTCGLALNDLTYCWGDNTSGEVGDGTTTQRLTPTRVHASGLRFRHVTSGDAHTCGRTANNLVYCWGTNFTGQLGAGTKTGPELCGEFACSTRPVAVTGGLHFSQVNAGFLHTCGVTPDNAAFCWGDNRGGQLGNGSNTGPQQCPFAPCSTRPVRVAGGLQFRQVDGGNFHTCGVTTNNVAYCWGQNDGGNIGNGTFFQSSLMPDKVRGGIHFRVVSAGISSCGITSANVAYCWGREGTLGDGTFTNRRTPVPVVGGLFFRQVHVGPSSLPSTCAVTINNVAYCWGIEPVA
ncbi:MAG TPA: hypothetical protein VFX42_07535, partial [Gemmatimonadales bacterium]|nr:hypothetical protein [Gemmatimonadales bacterium]